MEWGNDDEANGFVEDLTRAADSMEEALGQLRARELADAIEPEQRALQGLLRAEARLREFQISMQADGSDGGGGGSELEELIALEMDPSKNQYEMGERESSGEQADPAQDEAFRKLEELARRQQALAEELARSPEPTLAQRWRQETLRRELEQLQRSLANQPNASGELSRQLEAALGELSSASQPNATSRANAARESLERALERAQQERRGRLDHDVGELSRRARELAEAQQQTSERLQSAIERGVGSMEDDDFREPSEEERELAAEHTELQREVEALLGESDALAGRLREGAAALGSRLADARTELEQAEVPDTLARSGDLIRRGAAAFAGGSDEEVGRALEQFSAAAREIERGVRGSTFDTARADPDATLRRLQALRRSLQQAGERETTRTRRERWSPPEAWTELDPAAARAVSEALNAAGRSAPELAQEIEIGGGPRRTLRALGAGARPSDLDLAQRRREAIAELDQLELDLRARGPEQVAASQSASSLPSSIEDAEVPIYFRRLSEDEPRPTLAED